MTKRTIRRWSIGAVLAFLVINLLWYGVTTWQYRPFLKAVPEHVTGVHAMTEKGISYNVKTPDYLSTVGNLAISNDKTGVWLIVWPNLIGKDEYGIRVQEEQTGYEIIVDREMQLLEPDKTLQAVLDRHQVDVKRLKQAAHERFSLD